jgi:hypothetical protein
LRLHTGGTKGTSDVVNVTFHLALPQGEFDGIADQDWFLTGANLAFTLTASNPDGNVTTIQVFLNEQFGCQTNGVSVSRIDHTPARRYVVTGLVKGET